jgi:hypothetical protein
LIVQLVGTTKKVDRAMKADKYSKIARKSGSLLIDGVYLSQMLKLHGIEGGENAEGFVAAEDWAEDASGYFLEPGLLGGELIDDVMGIIFPAFALVDLATEYLPAASRGWNKLADEYNQARVTVVNNFREHSHEVVDILAGAVDYPIDKVLDPFVDGVLDIVDILPTELPNVPEIPELEWTDPTATGVHDKDELEEWAEEEDKRIEEEGGGATPIMKWIWDNTIGKWVT